MLISFYFILLDCVKEKVYQPHTVVEYKSGLNFCGEDMVWTVPTARQWIEQSKQTMANWGDS